VAIINKNINDKIEQFDRLLSELSSLEDKRKMLWLDVYTNALQDRDYAFNMYTHLSGFVTNGADPNVHALHGPNIAKYLERMSRANDQLLKLSELVAAAIEKDAEDKIPSRDELYEQFAEMEVPKAGSKR
jgi:hypothetical protein